MRPRNEHVGIRPRRKDKERLIRMFERLQAHYGPTHWWPAETPFEVALGAILTQNTAWRNVEKAVHALKGRGLLDPFLLLEATDDVLHECLRPTGYFRRKADRVRHFCRFLIERADGSMEVLAHMPNLREALLAIHGIGHETADDILLYACGHSVFVVDAYTRRVLYRHGFTTMATAPYETLRRYLESALPRDVGVYREFHALLVYVGKDYCRRVPQCAGCPLSPLLRRGEPRMDRRHGKRINEVRLGG